MSDRPGWYEDEHGVERWWDGEAWTEELREPEEVVQRKRTRSKWTAGDYITYGIGGSILGYGLFGFGVDDSNENLIWVGSLIASVATIVLLIGIIAQGVAVGMRSDD